MKYKIEVTAMACDRKLSDFIAAACGYDMRHVGVPTTFVLETSIEPTFEYLQALEKHIESSWEREEGKDMPTYYIDAKARRIA